jgi:hypothetical protein
VSDLAVISYDQLTPQLTVQPLGVISLALPPEEPLKKLESASG